MQDNERNSSGILSIVFGAIGIVCSFFVAAIVGIIVAAVGVWMVIRSRNKNGGFAWIIGLILCIIAVIIALLAMFL